MCPDFPTIGGASAAQVWAYATRRVTNIDDTRAAKIDNLDQTISQVKADILVDPATDKIDGSDIDQAISAVKADILVDPATDKIDGSNIDALISSRSSHDATAVWAVATRTITAFTGTPRTDLIGSDASFEAATGRPAKLDDIPYFETPVEGSLLMDGTEQTLVEKTDDKAGLLEGMINLTSMASGDTVVVREYMQVLSTGAYVKYAEETYTDAQSIPLLQIMTRISTHDIKVTIQQTGGTNRTFEYSFVRRRKT